MQRVLSQRRTLIFEFRQAGAQ